MKALGKGSIASYVRIGLLVMWLVLWLAAALLMLASIGYGVLHILAASGVIDGAILAGETASVQLGTEGGGQIHITADDPGGLSWPVVVPVLLIFGAMVTGSLVIVWRLRRLFDSFTSGEPFRRENAQHLRVIWITMVIVEITRYLLMGLTTLLLIQFGGAGVDDLKLDIGVDSERLSTWMSIFILIVLAEVFREGARLKEEQELTI